MTPIIDALNRLLDPMRRRVNGMVSRVVMTNRNDAPKRQEIQAEGFEDELMPVIEHFQPFGFYALPPVGSEGVGLAVGGHRNHLVVLALSDKTVATPPDMQGGSASLFCTDPLTYSIASAEGDNIHRAAKTWQAAIGDGENASRTLTAALMVDVVSDAGSGQFSKTTLSPESYLAEGFDIIHSAVHAWTARIGDGENTTMFMSEGLIVFTTIDPASGQFSKITITPGEVKIETPNFVHP